MKNKLVKYFVICCLVFTPLLVKGAEQTYTNKVSGDLESGIQHLSGKIKSLGNDLGKLVKCGNAGKLLKNGSCAFMEEEDKQVAGFAEELPVCSTDEFLVRTGTHSVRCKHLSQYDYLHKYDPISKKVCSGIPSVSGNNYCRCGNWVSKETFDRISNCSTASFPKINGQCSSSKNSCTSGSFKDVADTGSIYRWQCVGSNGGSTVSCTSSAKGCSGSRMLSHGGNTCVASYTLPHKYQVNQSISCKNTAKTSSITSTVWCQNGVLTVKSTTSFQLGGIKKPLNGQCGPSDRSCNVGTLKDVKDTTTHYKWQCLGSSGGQTAVCSLEKPKPAVHGVCENLLYECRSGGLKKIGFRGGAHRWQCVGSNGGNTATCSWKGYHGFDCRGRPPSLDRRWCRCRRWVTREEYDRTYEC